jgi:hypothetical protein
MTRKQKMITKKKRGRPATGINPLIGVRFPPDLLRALDRYIKEEEPKMSRPEALRQAFRDWAIGAGYLRHTADGPEHQN